MNVMNAALTAYMLIAPGFTDTDVENNRITVSIYDSIEECDQALDWINEHQMNLERHLWCSHTK